MTVLNRSLASVPAAGMLPRAARIVVLAILFGIGIDHVYWAIRQWPLGDLDVYLAAAQRIRDGQPIYDYANPAYATYWYAPWFAYAWVPLTYVPRVAVAIGWSAILLAATALLGWQLARVRSMAALALAVLVVPPLFAVSAGGNVQALLVLALMTGLSTRAGPLWIAIAASLKVTPVLFVLVYLRKGEWFRAGLALALTAALYLPAFALGLDPWRAASNADAPSLLGAAPALYGVAVVGVLAAGWIADRRYTPVAAATAAVLALPRLFVYDVTLLAAGVQPEPAEP